MAVFQCLSSLTKGSSKLRDQFGSKSITQVPFIKIAVENFICRIMHTLSYDEKGSGIITGKTYTVYLKEDQANFVENETNGFKEVVRSSIDERMEILMNQNTEQIILDLKTEYIELGKKIKKMEVRKKEKAVAIKQLFSEYDALDSGFRKGYITGAQGTKLLSDAGLTHHQFLKEFRKHKQ